MNIISVCVAKK